MSPPFFRLWHLISLLCNSPEISFLPRTPFFCDRPVTWNQLYWQGIGAREGGANLLDDLITELKAEEEESSLLAAVGPAHLNHAVQAERLRAGVCHIEEAIPSHTLRLGEMVEFLDEFAQLRVDVCAEGLHATHFCGELNLKKVLVQLEEIHGMKQQRNADCTLIDLVKCCLHLHAICSLRIESRQQMPNRKREICSMLISGTSDGCFQSQKWGFNLLLDDSHRRL